MMSGNAKPILKQIVGGLLFVSVLHYVLDEPTRSALIRVLFERRSQPALLRENPSDEETPFDDGPSLGGALTAERWVGNPSFERWDVQPSPAPQTWFSSVTISASEVVKKETEIVQHGRRAVRLEHDGVGHCGNLQQALRDDVILSLRGRRLTFSVWALSRIPGAPCVHIQIDDEPVHPTACLQHPSGTWQPVTVERMISPEATRIMLIIDISRQAVGETVDWVYVDNVSLAESLPSEGR